MAASRTRAARTSASWEARARRRRQASSRDCSRPTCSSRSERRSWVSTPAEPRTAPALSCHGCPRRSSRIACSPSQIMRPPDGNAYPLKETEALLEVTSSSSTSSTPSSRGSNRLRSRPRCGDTSLSPPTARIPIATSSGVTRRIRWSDDAKCRSTRRRCSPIAPRIAPRPTRSRSSECSPRYHSSMKQPTRLATWSSGSRARPAVMTPGSTTRARTRDSLAPPASRSCRGGST